MKKEIIICIIVVLTVVVLDIITEKHTEKVIDRMEAELEELRQNMIKNNKEIIGETQMIIDNWLYEKNLLSIYIEHDELEKIETCLREVLSSTDTKDYEGAIQSLDTSVFLMNHIKDKYKLSIKNIF